ncbi:MULTISPECIES: hypothetical protein [Thiorhodovibrio]|uniref:hypothetical protein n=1 Tax=Thiorhodovibrio TaxID=61593 RepID=UPI0019127A91|nr:MULTISPECIES: hypothetical protein [Thiorhodovibrio]MBK5971240.1 hypothetical protein [Thiorhodovibrio winogradskyi]
MSRLVAGLAFFVSLQFSFASAMAWEPHANADRSGDPGWYRAGQSPEYGTAGTGYSTGGRSGGEYPRVTYPSGAYPADAYSGSGGDWSGWSAETGAYGQPAPSQPNEQSAPAVDPSSSQPTAGWPPQTGEPWGDAQSVPFYYPNEAGSGYRFRGDGESRNDGAAPQWRGGPQPADRFRGYRFREDERLDVRGQRNTVDSAYRFRPLEADDGDSGSGRGFREDSAYPSVPGYDFRPSDSGR